MSESTTRSPFQWRIKTAANLGVWRSLHRKEPKHRVSTVGYAHSGVHIHEGQRPIGPTVPRRRSVIPTERLQTRFGNHDQLPCERGLNSHTPHGRRHKAPPQPFALTTTSSWTRPCATRLSSSRLIHATHHKTHTHTNTPCLQSQNRDKNTHTRAPTQHTIIHTQSQYKTTGALPLRRRLLDEDEAADDDMEDIHDIAGGTDFAEIDSDVHEALMRRTKDNSKPADLRLWRYWCAFSVLVLSLDLRSAWRSWRTARHRHKTQRRTRPHALRHMAVQTFQKVANSSTGSLNGQINTPSEGRHGHHRTGPRTPIIQEEQKG